MKQDVDDKTIDMFGAEGSTTKKRMTLSISADAGEKLRALQGVFERGIGFEPSLAQIVEHLINEYSNTKSDKMTPGHSVEANTN